MRSLTRLSLALALLSACSDAPATKSAAPITAAAGADAGGGPASASAVPTPANCNQSVFDAWVKKVATELAGQRVTGGSVAVVCGDTIFASGMGVTAAAGGKPVDAHTRFNIGSTQKSLTAVAALRLIEQGKVALEDPASKWVAGVSGINTASPYARSFTFGELLSHVSGYSTTPPDSNQASELEAFIQGMGPQPLWSPPGVVFNYNNIGFELAGLIMQRAAQAPFASLIESLVFAPAGMTDARMDPAVVEREGNFASAYPAGAGPYRPTDVVTPAMGPDTGAFASAADLAHFAHTLMHGGGAMLSPASVTKMTTQRTPTEDPSQGYALGMFVADMGGTAVWSHPGDNTGYQSDLTIVPSRGFASVILLNSDESGPPTTYTSAVQTFTGAPLPAPNAAPFEAATAAEHAGTYQSAAFGPITVATAGSAPTITIAGKTETLTPIWRDTYSFPYEPWGTSIIVTFWRDAGRVKYVVSRAFVGTKG